MGNHLSEDKIIEAPSLQEHEQSRGPALQSRHELLRDESTNGADLDGITLSSQSQDL